ncbi:hypothetical protein C0Q70_18690 [Pomacea canaliculata]|uniref:C-type lectin domain-containing protein n=1 Tax=Pomacea canaliculata TaxID=400727 RepID=A0A2T7NH82_POMCA|nr:hypothetical protein C0Q70_18690 [Pomacea canaliculata]
MHEIERVRVDDVLPRSDESHCQRAVYEARSLVLFKAGKRWNEARNVCAQGNGYLATADKYTMSILLQTKNNGVISMWDNVWIGLHTADPVYNMLSAKGFVWEDCQMLGDWTNWQADQPSNRYNNCIPIDVINQDSFPSNHCDSLTTQGPDTTSRLSQRTTVVTRTSGSPGTDVTLRESTGTSTLSTRDGTRTVTNIPTTERTQDVTNVPTTEGTQAVTNIPTTDGTQAVTNVPTTEGTQAVTNVPTRQGTQDVTNIPTREGTQDVTNVKTTEGTQGVTTTTIGAQTTTTLTTTVGGQWGQTSIATVLSTESKTLIHQHQRTVGCQAGGDQEAVLEQEQPVVMETEERKCEGQPRLCSNCRPHRSCLPRGRRFLDRPL